MWLGPLELSIRMIPCIYADFCGYFPVEKPKYTVFVSYKRPEIPVSGGGMAGQTFRKIAEQIMKTCK